MRKQQKVILYTIGFPIPGCLAVMLFFNNDFLELKPGKFKKLRGFKRKRLYHSLLAGITHKYFA